jgi:UDP-glucose 4-epimerase
VFVADVARATLAAQDSDGGTYNVGTGRETSVVELLERIQHVAGTSVEPELAEPRPGELQRSVLNITRANRELGWRPEHGLDAGLAETWAWISRA